MTAGVYTLGRDMAETERLRRQAQELRAQSVALLDRVGDIGGGSAIDVGCGPAGILDLLAERTGSTGHVVGLDSDPNHAAAARAFARERSLPQVDVLCADAGDTGLPGSFELVHARTLLVNIPAPAAVLEEMVRLALPGAHVLVHEPDMVGCICEPISPAFERLLELLVSTFRRDGADPFIGRRLPALLKAAGLTEVEVEGRVTLHPLGHSRRTILPDLVRALRPKILGCGLVTGSELDRLDAEAREHLRDGRVALYDLFFLGHGRRPTYCPPRG
jgi:SAM-dependent methyltransferase